MVLFQTLRWSTVFVKSLDILIAFPSSYMLIVQCVVILKNDCKKALSVKNIACKQK